jgi:PKD repeat protein
LSTGSNITYFWDWGDGQAENTTIWGINHTYTARGLYNITIDIVNALSDQHNTSYVIVEVRVLAPDLSLSLSPSLSLSLSL